MKIKEPAFRWRTLPSHGRHEFASTEEEIRELGRAQAQELGTRVGIELWSEDHPMDDLNRGWACVGTVDYQPPASGD